jgi:hypothetical protein
VSLRARKPSTPPQVFAPSCMSNRFLQAESAANGRGPCKTRSQLPGGALNESRLLRRRQGPAKEIYKQSSSFQCQIVEILSLSVRNRIIRESYGNLNETDNAATIGTLPMPLMTTGSNSH